MLTSQMHRIDRPPTALLVGTDQVLLYTRKAILEQQGFEVHVIAPAKVTVLLSSSEYNTEMADVIVACHTLSVDEIHALGKAARKRPEKPALIGFTKGISVPEPSPFDASIWSLASPDAFLHTVQKVLKSSYTRAATDSSTP